MKDQKDCVPPDKKITFIHTCILEWVFTLIKMPTFIVMYMVTELPEEKAFHIKKSILYASGAKVKGHYTWMN